MKNKDTVKTAYAYLRVGSGHQMASENSIDSQKEAIKRYCRENNIRLIDVFIDCPASAKDLNRKNLIRMLGRSVINPVNYIIVYSLDRLSRGYVDQCILGQQLSKFGTEIKSLSQTSLSFDSVKEMFEVVDTFQSRLLKAPHDICCVCTNR